MTVGTNTDLVEGERAGRLMRRATTAALFVAVLLALAKIVAFFITGSVAMLGSLIDSVLDIFATGFNFFAVRTALKPPDREHRFGHGKAEPIAGLMQGAFIGASAAFLLYQSVARLFRPVQVEASLTGIVVTIFALAVTVLLVLYQRHVVKRTRSIAVGADELHYRSDLILNGAVLVAFALSGPVADLPYADPLIGGGIAVYVALGAYRIARRSYDQLMDHEFDEAERDRIKELVRAHPEVVSLHDLRTRRSGRDAFIQLHLELSPRISLIEAHRIADEVEAELHNAFPEAEVMIHEDPAGYDTPPATSVSAS